jgi:hypothetical protein
MGLWSTFRRLWFDPNPPTVVIENKMRKKNLNFHAINKWLGVFYVPIGRSLTFPSGNGVRQNVGNFSNEYIFSVSSVA